MYISKEELIVILDYYLNPIRDELNIIRSAVCQSDDSRDLSNVKRVCHVETDNKFRPLSKKDIKRIEKIISLVDAKEEVKKLEEEKDFID